VKLAARKASDEEETTRRHVLGSMTMPYPTPLLRAARCATAAGRHALALPVLGALLWAAATQAAPAPWYWWVSKLDGKRVCAQHMPASGWERAEGRSPRQAARRSAACLAGGPGRWPGAQRRVTRAQAASGRPAYHAGWTGRRRPNSALPTELPMPSWNP
jgi:hypothetical protein